MEDTTIKLIDFLEYISYIHIVNFLNNTISKGVSFSQDPR